MHSKFSLMELFRKLQQPESSYIIQQASKFSVPCCFKSGFLCHSHFEFPFLRFIYLNQSNSQKEYIDLQYIHYVNELSILIITRFINIIGAVNAQIAPLSLEIQHLLRKVLTRCKRLIALISFNHSVIKTVITYANLSPST